MRAYAIDRRRARAAIAAAGTDGWLPGSAAEALLGAVGLPFAPSRVVTSAEAAISASHALGYPVVLKAESRDLLHKTDAGGVEVDLRNADEVVRAYTDIAQRLGRKYRGFAVKVQKMVRGGHEVILGMTRDPQYGPLLMFGLGGIHVEILRDVAVRVHPITDVQAREMIRSIRGYPLLAGARGAAASNLATLEGCLLRLSALAGAFEEIQEIDVNPLIVAPKRGRSLIVDARVRVASPT